MCLLDLIRGLTVVIQTGKADYICLLHPTAPIEKGRMFYAGGLSTIYWKCCLCTNSAEWVDDAERENALSSADLTAIHRTFEIGSST
jgi:hypothetical protein